MTTYRTYILGHESCVVREFPRAQWVHFYQSNWRVLHIDGFEIDGSWTPMRRRYRIRMAPFSERMGLGR